MSDVITYGSSHYLDDLQTHEEDHVDLSKWIQCLDVRNNNGFHGNNGH
jgi:hypothetical protein